MRLALTVSWADVSPTPPYPHIASAASAGLPQFQCGHVVGTATWAVGERDGAASRGRLFYSRSALLKRSRAHVKPHMGKLVVFAFSRLDLTSGLLCISCTARSAGMVAAAAALQRTTEHRGPSRSFRAPSETCSGTGPGTGLEPVETRRRAGFAAGWDRSARL